jgi:hypothetical protein
MKYLVKYEAKGKNKSVVVVAYNVGAASQAVYDSYDYPIKVKSVKEV